MRKTTMLSFVRHMLISLIFAAFLLLIPNIQLFAKIKGKDLITKGSKPEKLAGGFLFTEGPTCDSKGNIFFTDQDNDRIMEWSSDNKLSLFIQKSGRANGTQFDNNGNLITCSDEKNELWSIAPDGKIKVLIKDFEGKRLNGPNDVWVAPNGGIYLTDPFYKRSWWDHDKREQDGEHVYFLAPGATKLIRVVSDFQQPNGIIGTPDGKYLYVSDIRAKKIWRYSICKDGTLNGKKLFTKQGSDGMTIDNEGNIYTTGNGVTIFDPKGRIIIKIPTEESWTTNVCFGGKDRNLLFITAVKSVYGLKMNVKGTRYK